MSFIAKVVAPDPGDEPRGGRARSSDGRIASGPSSRDAAFPIFEPDLRQLSRRGFAIPTEAGRSICGEVRIIKRRLLRRLDFLHRDGPSSQNETGACPTVLVTSSEPEEGKTFLATNLALSLAIEERLRVLLVDGDLLKPSLAGILDLGSRLGLGDSFLDPSIPAEQIISRASQFPLGVVTAGRNTDAFTEGLISHSLSGVLESLARAYQAPLVIVDGPPVLATTEAAMLAEQVDEIVFVVRAAQTPTHRVSAALDLLNSEDRLSVVLNRAPFARKAPSYRNYEPANRLK